MQVNRVSLGKKKLVYVILAQKLLRYPWGHSKIACIGTTKKGMDRIAQSVAARADTVLGLHGVKEFTVRMLTCNPRSNVKTWVKLENALLLLFRQTHGKLPFCNEKGKQRKETNEFRYFRREQLEKTLATLG
jgi:hypothetical protein